jgi:hypothetical protein
MSERPQGLFSGFRHTEHLLDPPIRNPPRMYRAGGCAFNVSAPNGGDILHRVKCYFRPRPPTVPGELSIRLPPIPQGRAS